MKNPGGDPLSDCVTAVLGYSELLLEEAYGPLNSNQEEILKCVLEAAKRLQTIVRENPPFLVAD